MSSKKYDEECIRRYGIKTCIVSQLYDDIFELRLMDFSKSEIIYRKNLYSIIPEMLTNNYTVILIENFKDENLKVIPEITAVHMPVQAYLNTPPIIQ